MQLARATPFWVHYALDAQAALCLWQRHAWSHVPLTACSPPRNLHQQRAQLCFYDEEGVGELGRAQLERYLADGASYNILRMLFPQNHPAHVLDTAWGLQLGSRVLPPSLAHSCRVTPPPTAVAQELPLLNAMEPWFLPHYTRITARKLLFFHGRRRARGGEVSIRCAQCKGGPR